MRTTGNLLLRTDSYKFTHWKQYPPGTEQVYSYFESRGGKWPEVVFFGLQYYLKKYLEGPVVTRQAIDEAEEMVGRHFGDASLFNRRGWEYLLWVHGGRLPLRILAVPEGTPVPPHNVLMTVENTDPVCYWLPNYVETLLVQAWYGSTVATQSREMKKLVLKYLERTGDPSLIDFKVHDFGFRGVSSVESAGVGGAAHPAQLSRHRHLRRHRRRPRLLWRADGRLLHSRGRTFDHHRLGPQPRSRRDAEHVGAISPRHDRGGQRQLRRVPGLRQDLGADAARAGAGPRRLRSHSARLRRSRQRAGHRHAQRARDSGRPFRLHGQRQGLQGPQPARPSHPERRR